MRHNRALSLKRETLTELTSGEMTAIAGGTHAGCGVTANCTHYSFDACPSVPINCITTVIAVTDACTN